MKILILILLAFLVFSCEERKPQPKTTEQLELDKSLNAADKYWLNDCIKDRRVSWCYRRLSEMKIKAGNCGTAEE